MNSSFSYKWFAASMKVGKGECMRGSERRGDEGKRKEQIQERERYGRGHMWNIIEYLFYLVKGGGGRFL
jgi:hypothetical protein